VGPLIATALVAAVGNAGEFKSGRELAAYIGLVPRHRASGGRTVLLGISKRGDRYLRTLLVHGARSAMRTIERLILRGVSGPAVSSSDAEATWPRWHWRIRMRDCCGRYSPKVRVIEQRRFPPAYPKRVEGTAGGNADLMANRSDRHFRKPGMWVRPTRPQN
jgi:Transposase IS116/IS110/IS902 family